MPAAFAGADVLLDQFRAGSYGVAACEAMAAGCIVVGQVSAQTRDVVRERTGLVLPIVEASPDTLEHILRELAGRDDLDTPRAASVAFVREVHDGRASARALIDGWLSPSDIPGRDENETGA